jgi:hypothetical protein
MTDAQLYVTMVLEGALREQRRELTTAERFLQDLVDAKATRHSKEFYANKVKLHQGRIEALQAAIEKLRK